MADAGSLQHRIISPSTSQSPFRALHIPPAVKSGGRTHEECYLTPTQRQLIGQVAETLRRGLMRMWGPSVAPPPPLRKHQERQKNDGQTESRCSDKAVLACDARYQPSQE